MPELEPEVDRFLRQRKCATCSHWGQYKKGLFKTMAKQVFFARQCGVNPKLVTFYNDACKDWRRYGAP